jgi:hypothetical protein
MTFNMMGVWCLSFAILFSRRYGGGLRGARTMLVMQRDSQVDDSSCFDWRNHIASSRITVNQ